MCMWSKKSTLGDRLEDSLDVIRKNFRMPRITTDWTGSLWAIYGDGDDRQRDIRKLDFAKIPNIPTCASARYIHFFLPPIYKMACCSIEQQKRKEKKKWIIGICEGVCIKGGLRVGCDRRQEYEGFEYILKSAARVWSERVPLPKVNCFDSPIL